MRNQPGLDHQSTGRTGQSAVDPPPQLTGVWRWAQLASDVRRAGERSQLRQRAGEIGDALRLPSSPVPEGRVVSILHLSTGGSNRDTRISQRKPVSGSQRKAAHSSQLLYWVSGACKQPRQQQQRPTTTGPPSHVSADAHQIPLRLVPPPLGTANPLLAQVSTEQPVHTPLLRGHTVARSHCCGLWGRSIA